MARFNMADLLGAQGKQPDISRWETTEIDLARLVPSPDNHYGIRDIEALAASIDETGLLHNLVVQEQGNGNYTIISGERRYHALLLLRRQTAPCLIIPKESATAKLQLLLANAMTRELTDYEKVMQAMELRGELTRLKKEYHTFSGRMRENVADVLGISSAQVGRWESIYKNLTPEQMDDFRDERIGISEAYELSCRKAKGATPKWAPKPTPPTGKSNREVLPPPTTIPQAPKTMMPPEVPSQVKVEEASHTREAEGSTAPSGKYGESNKSSEIAGVPDVLASMESVANTANPANPANTVINIAGETNHFERMTEYDEYGNADIIGVAGDEYYCELNFEQASIMTDAHNRLAAYEDTGKTPEEVAAWARGHESIY